MKTKVCYICKEEKPVTEFRPYKNGEHKGLYFCYCKPCEKWSVKEFIRTHPWVRQYKQIRNRCNNTKYRDFKYYGGKGIKATITREGLRQLWFRDKAYLMKRPSIHRKDNDKDYAFNNCEYLELSENCRLSQLKTPTKKEE